MARHGFAGMFWKAVPKGQWPEDEDSLNEIQKNWQDPFGDMRQELVFIGQNLDQLQFNQALNDCLLNDDELLAGPTQWQHLADPFPIWEAEA